MNHESIVKHLQSVYSDHAGIMRPGRAAKGVGGMSDLLIAVPIWVLVFLIGQRLRDRCIIPGPYEDDNEDFVDPVWDWKK